MSFFRKECLSSLSLCQIALACILAFSSCKKDDGKLAQETFRVSRGNLDITVLESGSLETLVSNDIVQQIRRSVKILEIVDEGTMITDEDVDDQRVLVRFETKEIEDQLFERNTAFENAQASFTQAEESLTIQISDNESSLRSSELAVIYADNDFRKLVGDQMAERFAGSEKPQDIAILLDDPELGGQAKQDLTTLRSDIELAQIRLNRAEQKLEYTKKLYDKQFVSKNELETDELEVESQKKTLITAKGKYDIFCRYDFITNFHRVWATLINTKESLIRAQAVARSRLVSSQAVLRSQRQNLMRATTRLEEIKEDLANCTIRATAPGLVVYETPPRWMNTGPIRPGVEIRYRQTIIKLPNLNKMAVKVNIHESQIDLVSVTMPAIITVDAMPNRSFSGKVNKKALLPSSQNQWLTPDVKVYETMVSFDQSDPNLRPGMNATVEIVAEKLLDVLYIPSQSVRTDAQGRHFCFRADGTQVPIKLGKRNQSFVVVLEGLALGEEILMAPPQLQERSEEEADGELEKMLETQQREKMKESAEPPQNGKDENKAEASKEEQNGNGKANASGKKTEVGVETAKTE
jgi:HlyD family secretion protein